MATTAIAQPPVTAAVRVKWIPLLLAIAIGLGLYFMPAQHGLTRAGQTALAITAFTIVLWAFGVMNNGVASVLMMALLIPAGAKPALALSGFSTGSWWILLAVLYYGFAMQKTGLAARVSYYILSLFPGTYSGILAAFFVVGTVLSFGIPSMTVRTAIMVPIAWALVQSLGLKPRSKGSALIMLTTIEMAVVPGLGLLYGSLDGPVVASVFDLKHLPLSYGAYARILELPILVLCALIVFGNQWVLKPESALNASREFVRGKLRDLGSFKRDEAVTGVIVACSIVFWATDRWHHLPSFFIGMVGLAVFALAGIVGNADIAGGISWTLLLFMGGIFSLQNVLTEYKLTDWLAGYFVPVTTASDLQHRWLRYWRLGSQPCHVHFHSIPTASNTTSRLKVRCCVMGMKYPASQSVSLYSVRTFCRLKIPPMNRSKVQEIPPAMSPIGWPDISFP